MIEILRFTIPAFALGAAAFLWAGRNAGAERKRERWVKFATYFVIVHTVLAAAALGRGTIVGVLVLVTLFGFGELIHAGWRLPVPVAAGALVVFTLAAAGTLRFAFRAEPSCVSYLYILVAAFDGFSQVGGQLAGRTKLAPALSPGKTVEGFLIGAGAAVCTAMLLRSLAGLPGSSAAVVGIAAAAAGLAGDLAASWLKRRAGLKDFGRLLPGHGGVLDRFDSFFAAAAALSVSGLWR
jgi:phosphatidate cytidylyltransferase